jgi:hypothetical protein
MASTNKVIAGNDAALQSKYPTAFNAIQSAIASWIAADNARGVSSTYIAVDDPAKMSQFGGTAALPQDERSHKAAVDAIFASANPDYMVLLGSPDLFPHITLANPVYDPKKPKADPDQFVPSDLPYSCGAPYSAEPADFVGPARVVTRLPDIEGNTSANYLIRLITSASNARSLQRADYSGFLGVTASVWKTSSALSLSTVFGSSSAMLEVPPATYQWNAANLSERSHFFNCHGAQNNSHYYGQSGNSYPVAHDAAFIAGKLTSGTVLAAECCYGAELYDPTAAGGQAGIANVYLGSDAYAVWGSTTIAYGPATTNGQADLICQYFFQEILNGSSVGVAALLARQRFAANSTTLSPSDMKTLIQFICLGDASLHCVAGEEPSLSKTAVELLGESVVTDNRRMRRSFAIEDGNILSLFKRRASAETIPTPASVESTLLAIAKEYGIQEASILSKGVFVPPGPKAFPPTQGNLIDFEDVQAFHVIFDLDSEKNDGLDPEPNQPRNRRILEVGESSGRILMIRELFGR